MAAFSYPRATAFFRSSVTQNGYRLIATAIKESTRCFPAPNSPVIFKYHSINSRLISSTKSFRSFHTSTVVESSVPSCDGSPSSQPKLSFNIAASFVAKNHQFNSDQDYYEFKTEDQNDHLKKSLTPQQRHRINMHNRPGTGEDAFFVSQVGETSDVVMGIADGVGGWADSGVDPADFSHGICQYLKYEAATYQKEEWKGSDLCPLSLLQRGYDNISQDKSIVAGSSTACIAVARGNGRLEVANLGDSGYLQLRLNNIHSHSDPQTHFFNTPYQLSKIPQEIKSKTDIYGSSHLDDHPQDAAIIQNDLKHGDVLIIGSDGLWDNLFYSDVLRIVSRKMFRALAWENSPSGVRVGRDLAAKVFGNNSELSGSFRSSNLHRALAVNITAEAKAASVNTKMNGPFAQEVQQRYPKADWRGGKVDDICVIVAIVCEEGKS